MLAKWNWTCVSLYRSSEFLRSTMFWTLRASQRTSQPRASQIQRRREETHLVVSMLEQLDMSKTTARRSGFCASSSSSAAAFFLCHGSRPGLFQGLSPVGTLS